MPLLFTDRGGKRSLGREEKRRNMRSRKAPEPPFRKPGETPPRGRNDAGADTAADRKTPLPRGGKDVRPDRSTAQSPLPCGEMRAKTQNSTEDGGEGMGRNGGQAQPPL